MRLATWLERVSSPSLLVISRLEIHSISVRGSEGYWINWFLADLYCPAPLMQRVLNDLVLSEVLKSQIPAEAIRLLHTGRHCNERSEHCWWTAGSHNSVNTCSWNTSRYNSCAVNATFGTLEMFHFEGTRKQFNLMLSFEAVTVQWLYIWVVFIVRRQLKGVLYNATINHDP